MSFEDGLLGPSILIRRAQQHGFEIGEWDDAIVGASEEMACSPDQSERVIELADQAEDYFNSIEPEGFLFEWIDF